MYIRGTGLRYRGWVVRHGAVVPDEQRRCQREVESVMTTESPANILVIDDEPSVRRLLAVYLADAGHTVVDAPDGREGLAVFREAKPDVVLLDLSMPEMGGLEVLDHIRAESPDTPAIVISGGAVLSDAVEALRRGAWDYIVKPIVELGVLLHAVDKVLERARLIRENREYLTHLEEQVRERTMQLEESNQALRQEMEERERAEAMVRSLVRSTVGVTGQECFDRITVELGRCFDADCAIVALVSQQGQAQVLSAQDGGRPLTFDAFDIADTPSQAAIENGCCLFAEGVSDRFPGDALLESMGVRGYVGHAINDRDGHVIGLLCAMSRRPLQSWACWRDVMGILAARAAAEIERCQAESRLHEYARSLERKNVELEEFTHLASHDMQEPIRKVVSFGNLLRQDLSHDLPPEAERDLTFITEAASRMRCLVKDLLALSRAGRGAMKQEPVPLAACVDWVLDKMRDRIQATSAIIVQDELPSVMGDFTLLVELYRNLIDNALKFASPDRSPHIRLTAEEVDGVWQMGVEDNGIGIKPEYLDGVFAPFKRLHGRDDYEGTGIGLSVCRKTVERHGGLIWVESEWGNGSCVKFTIGEGASEWPGTSSEAATLLTNPMLEPTLCANSNYSPAS